MYSTEIEDGTDWNIEESDPWNDEEDEDTRECEDDVSLTGVRLEAKKGIERRARIGKQEAQAAKPEPTTAADLADQYLIARGYRDFLGLCLRRHRAEWLRFDGRTYRVLSEEELKADIMLYLRDSPIMRAKADAYVIRIVNQLMAICMIPELVDVPARYESGEWMTERETIVLQNGIVNLGDYKERLKIGLPPRVDLLPHSPTLVSRILLPFEYDPKATCPGWMQFLDQILPDPESRVLLQEIFGYCLTPDISQQKFFMFEGTGGNGKGVVTNILTRLLGQENVSALPINRFGASHELDVTLCKLVNITSEMKEKDALAEDLLKQFVAGDYLHFNPKYRKPFSAKPTAKLILSTNERPMFTDRSDGLWRRLIVLPFPVTIPEGHRDVNLEEKLSLELPGILNWAVAGTESLFRRGAFQEPQVSIEARKEFQRESNAARMFLEETCQINEGGEVEKIVLYQRYVQYCEENGVREMRSTNLYKEVRRVFPHVTEVRARGKDDKLRPYVFKGITISPPG